MLDDLVNIVPMKLHLVIDAIAGGLLIISPWFFDFAETVWRAHVIVGVIEIGLAITTFTHRGQTSEYPNPPRQAATTPTR